MLLFITRCVDWQRRSKSLKINIHEIYPKIQYLGNMVVGCCNGVPILSMADMVCLDSIQKLWSAWAVLGLYGMLEFKLCCEILLLLNMADMGHLLCVCVRLWSEQSWVPCSFNAYEYRLSACREFCGVHSWKFLHLRLGFWNLDSTCPYSVIHI